MARVVITGGAGFLGSHLCERFLGRGDEVVVLDNLSTGAVANIEHLFEEPGFAFVKHDVSTYVWVPGPVDLGKDSVLRPIILPVQGRVAPERVQQIEMAQRVDAVSLNYSAAHTLNNIVEQPAAILPAGLLPLWRRAHSGNYFRTAGSRPASETSCRTPSSPTTGRR